MNSPTLDPFAPLDAPRGCQEILDVLRAAGRPVTVRRLTSQVSLPTTTVRAAVRYLIRNGEVIGRDSGLSTLVAAPEFAAALLAGEHDQPHTARAA